MEIQEYIDKLKALLIQHCAIEDVVSEINFDIPTIVLPKNKVHDVLAFLKTDPQFGLSFLTTMCGIHFPENENQEYALMYQLHNMSNNTRLRIRTYMSKDDQNIATITDLWATANWMEREAFDFYGFIFNGHPNLSRLLNMDEMNYHPLRKEYALEDGSRLDKDDTYFGR